MEYWFTEKSWKCYAEWKKLVTKGHILFHSIYIKYLEQANLYTQKVSGFPGLKVGQYVTP